VPSRTALALKSIVFALASVGPACMLIYAQLVLPARRWHHALWLPSLLVIGVGVAWSTSLAVLSAFWSRDLRFVRTPKFGIGPGGGQWRGRRYASSRPWGGLAELGLGLYCAWTAWVLGEQGHYGVLPFMLLYTAGFLTVGALTVLQAMPRVRGAVLLLLALLGGVSYCASTQVSDPFSLTETFEKEIRSGWPSAVPRWSVEIRRGPAFL